MSAAQEVAFVAYPAIVGIVAEACYGDPAARAVAEKDDLRAFADQDEETQRFWRLIANTALKASGHHELYEAVRLFVEEYDAADQDEGVAMMLAYNRALEAGKAALAKARGDA